MKVFSPVLPSTSQITPYLQKIEESGQFSNGGPLVKLLEQRLSEHFGVPVDNVAVCSSATLALHGAISTSSKNSRWQLPSWTFTATPGALLQSGVSGTFVDVDEEQRAIFTDKNSNFIDVLPFGAGYDSSRILSSKKPLIIDAAASFDACENFQFNSNVDTGVVVSLHATKTLPAGEGGIFFSDNADWVTEFRQWGNFGMWGSRVSEIAGTNTKMSEYTAAVALSSLDNWTEYKKRWEIQSKRAERVALDFGNFIKDVSTRRFASPYWNVLLNNEDERINFESFLESKGIETRRWWGGGCHSMPAYSEFNLEQLQNTQDFASRMLGLPFHLKLMEEDFETIHSAINEFIKQ